MDPWLIVGAEATAIVSLALFIAKLYKDNRS
jgi:hypothetical protein